MKGPGPRMPGALRRGRARRKGSRYRGLVVLAAAIAVLPWFLPNNFYFNVAILTGLNAIVCVGLNLLIGYAGQISLGHAGFFGLGAYGSAILTTHFGWPPIPALVASAVAVGVIALLVARPILTLKGHYLAMATLGMGVIVSIALVQEGNLTGGPDGMTVAPLRFFDVDLVGEKYWFWIVGSVLVAAVWLALNLVDSPVGRALRGLHGSEIAAEAMAVDTVRYKTLVFVISALFASVAGSLFAYYSGFLTPAEAGFLRSIQFVTMVVLGGMASTYGAVIGAAILTVLPQALTVFHDYEQVALGLILMLTMVFMPKGLAPSLAQRLKEWRS
jgi:branched-chain amino acid transport system permease protein